MANKNKQEGGGLQGKQGNKAGGLRNQTSGKKSQGSTKHTNVADARSEGLQQGGSRGSSNQGKD
jgi:hypothetical protein